MQELLDNELNLNLLKLICSGDGVEVNISQLSKQLKKHRNTIKERVAELFEHKIIDKPIYPFAWLFKEYPLLVVLRSDFPRDEKTNNFIEKDDNIFAAFFFKEEEYNTLTLQFHKNIHMYQLWRDSIVKERKITLGETRHPSDTQYFSTELIVKYNPSSSIQVMEQNLKSKRQTQINDYPIDQLSFDILKMLLEGEGIRTNENYLASQLNVHRRTIESKLKALVEAKIVSRPVCRFPRLVVPPGYILVMSLVEIKKQKETVLRAMFNDSHIPMMVKASTGRYNLLLLSTFYKMEDHLEWEEEYDQRFPACFGAIKNTYLSPAMTFSIDQGYVSMMLIKNKLKRMRGKKLVDMMKVKEQI